MSLTPPPQLCLWSTSFVAMCHFNPWSVGLIYHGPNCILKRTLCSLCFQSLIDAEIKGLLQLSNHMVQNRQTGEQMSHWDLLNKATKFEFSLFNISQYIICSPVWRFCTTWLLSCKRPIAHEQWYSMIQTSSITTSNSIKTTALSLP